MHYDGNGQLRNWWNPDTAKKFNITTQCVRKTYSSYQVDHLYVSIEFFSAFYTLSSLINFGTL